MSTVSAVTVGISARAGLAPWGYDLGMRHVL